MDLHVCVRHTHAPQLRLPPVSISVHFRLFFSRKCFEEAFNTHSARFVLPYLYP